MTTKVMPEWAFFPAWKMNFEKQLTQLHARVSKTAETLGWVDTPHLDDYNDFCKYIYEEQPDLIDYHQN